LLATYTPAGGATQVVLPKTENGARIGCLCMVRADDSINLVGGRFFAS
jgi:hypothetical protein